MLLARILSSFGYAVLLPNPRGSTGRGQEFARKVYGDLGGAEVHDHLAGIDGLVADGLADTVRLGVTGGSHGGFMTSWIVTQTDRFAAAVPVVPHTDHYSFLGTSNIGSYIERFLQDDPTNQGGRFFTRSPILFAGRTKTPCLNIAGGQDRCCPPTQATEFHHALLEHGVRSELVVYPEEGHGVRKLPAQIDFVTRVVDWFQRHMPASDGAVS